MSRSFRKTPIFGWTNARSEKYDKIQANRKIRRINVMEKPVVKRITNTWNFAKDGKKYWLEATKKDLAK